MKKAVLYFSATGITKRAAEKLARENNADLIEIVPEIPYTAADLDWTDKNSRNVIEAHDAFCRPAIKNLPDLSGYDKIWLGFPIWWYTAPRIIETAAQKLPAHTTVIPFATSGGSTIDKAEADLKKTAPAAITWQKGFMMNGR